MNDTRRPAAKVESLPPGERDAAALRQAFHRAAETFPASVSTFLDSRGPQGKEELAKLMAWWNRFYEAVRDHQAGLRVLAEIANLKADAPPPARTLTCPQCFAACDTATHDSTRGWRCPQCPK